MSTTSLTEAGCVKFGIDNRVLSMYHMSVMMFRREVEGKELSSTPREVHSYG